MSTLTCFEEELAGLKVDCSELFTRVPTDSGMCCALNTENSLKTS